MYCSCADGTNIVYKIDWKGNDNIKDKVESLET